MIEELIFVVQQHVFLFPIHDLQLTVVARVRKTGFDFRPSLNFQCLEIGKVIVAGIWGLGLSKLTSLQMQSGTQGCLHYCVDCVLENSNENS